MTHATSDGGPRDVLAQAQRAARELLHGAPYGSLVLWGGRLVHGLRFATIGPAGENAAATTAEPGSPVRGGLAGPDPTAPPDVHDARELADERHAGPVPADAAPGDLVLADLTPAALAPAGHAAEEPNLFEQFEVTEPAVRLVLLAPFAVGRLLGTEDQACRLQICGSVASNGCEWVSVALAGWVAPVKGVAVSELALAFAERHPTPDLLDLGSAWVLLEVDLAEATVRTRSTCVRLDTSDAVDLLRGPDGTLQTDTSRWETA